jgi:predicted phosphodiesterase
MTSIRIISDLHLEFNDAARFTARFAALPKADYLVVAGDACTCSTIDRFRSFLNAVSPLYVQVLYVLGNHEYYQTSHDPSELVNVFRSKLDMPNVSLLENQLYKDERVSIYGSTLWSDIHPRGFRMMRDSNFVSHEFYLKKHKEAKQGLESLGEREVDLVVTHHMPSFRFVHPKYHHYGKEMNSGFYSDCDSFFTRPRKAWVFGHTHERIREKVDEVEFVCNPVGYPKEHPDWNDVVMVV